MHEGTLPCGTVANAEMREQMKVAWCTAHTVSGRRPGTGGTHMITGHTETQLYTVSLLMGTVSSYGTFAHARTIWNTNRFPLNQLLYNLYNKRPCFSFLLYFRSKRGIKSQTTTDEHFKSILQNITIKVIVFLTVEVYKINAFI